MKLKILRYIIFLLVIILLFFGVSIADESVKTYLKNTGDTNSFILQFIIYCIAGGILGLEKILSERKKNGRWKINLLRLIVVGLPSFLVGIIVILIFALALNSQILTLSFVSFNLFVNFMQMFFGYIIVTSFYKTEEISLTNK